MVAQKGVLAVAEVSPIIQTSSVLVKNCSSKSIPIAEFACRSLELFCKTCPPELFIEPQHEELCLQVVHCLFEVLD